MAKTRRTFMLKKENYDWLKQEKMRRKVPMGRIIDDLIEKYKRGKNHA